MDYVLWYCARVMSAIKVWQIVGLSSWVFMELNIAAHTSAKTLITHREGREQTLLLLTKQITGWSKLALGVWSGIGTQLLELNYGTMWTFVPHLDFKWWSGGSKYSYVCFCMCLSVPLSLSDSVMFFYKHCIHISINCTRNKSVIVRVKSIAVHCLNENVIPKF